MSTGIVSVSGGTPERGLDVAMRPHDGVRRAGAACKLLAMGGTLFVPVALLRGGPQGALAVVLIVVVTYGLGTVLREATQHLVVAPKSRTVRAGYSIGTRALPFTTREVVATSRGAVHVVRERNASGDHSSPEWVFVVRVLPIATSETAVTVFRAFEHADAAVVASHLGVTLGLAARDLTEPMVEQVRDGSA